MKASWIASTPMTSRMLRAVSPASQRLPDRRSGRPARGRRIRALAAVTRQVRPQTTGLAPRPGDARTPGAVADSVYRARRRSSLGAPNDRDLSVAVLRLRRTPTTTPRPDLLVATLPVADDRRGSRSEPGHILGTRPVRRWTPPCDHGTQDPVRASNAAPRTKQGRQGEPV